MIQPSQLSIDSGRLHGLIARDELHGEAHADSSRGAAEGIRGLHGRPDEQVDLQYCFEQQ